MFQSVKRIMHRLLRPAELLFLARASVVEGEDTRVRSSSNQSTYTGDTRIIHPMVAPATTAIATDETCSGTPDKSTIQLRQQS